MRRFRVVVDGQSYDVSVEELQEPQLAPAKTPATKSAPAAKAHVQAPMPGRIVDVRVSRGAAVSPDSVVMVLEAMKMENDILAGTAGVIAAVHVQPGDAVNTGDPLIELE